MSTDDLISIGKITTTHGIKGDVKIASSTNIFSDTKTPISLQMKTSQSEYKTIEIIRAKLIKKGKFNTYIAHISDFNSLTDVETIAGNTLWVDKKSLPMPSDSEYYSFQLNNLEAVSKNEKTGFIITEILDNPAHTIFQFTKDDETILVPFVEKYIGQVDNDKSEIEVFHWEDWFEI